MLLTENNNHSSPLLLPLPECMSAWMRVANAFQIHFVAYRSFRPYCWMTTWRIRAAEMRPLRTEFPPIHCVPHRKLFSDLVGTLVCLRHRRMEKIYYDDVLIFWIYCAREKFWRRRRRRNRKFLFFLFYSSLNRIGASFCALY